MGISTVDGAISFQTSNFSLTGVEPNAKITIINFK